MKKGLIQLASAAFLAGSLALASCTAYLVPRENVAVRIITPRYHTRHCDPTIGIYYEYPGHSSCYSIGYHNINLQLDLMYQRHRSEQRHDDFRQPPHRPAFQYQRHEPAFPQSPKAERRGSLNLSTHQPKDTPSTHKLKLKTQSSTPERTLKPKTDATSHKKHKP